MQIMKPARRASRRVRAAIVVATAALAAACAQAAETFPSRPMRLISASAAGAGSDVIGRILAPRLVVHHHRLPEALRQRGGKGAGDDVGAAARREGHHQPDRPVRIVLCGRAQGTMILTG
jgi:tripartite-type tricarboxylate transporter receptor subunit TctC